MGVLDKMNDRLSSMISQLERSTGKAGASADRVQSTTGSYSAPNNYVGAAMLGGNQRALDAAIKSETKARNAATRMLEAEAAEKKALIPQLKAEAKLSAFKNRTEEQQARAYESARRLGIGNAAASGGLPAGMGGLARHLAPVGAAYAIKHAMEFGAGALNMAQREDIPQARRDQNIGESIPILGSFLKSIREFGEALNGTAEAVRQMQQRFQEMRIAIPLEGSARQRISGIDLGVARANFDVQSIRNNPLPAIQRFDQTTMSGQQAYHDYQSLQLPAQTAAVMANRTAETARNALGVLREQRDAQLSRYEQAQRNDLAARGTRAAYERQNQRPSRGWWESKWEWLKGPASEDWGRPRYDRAEDMRTATGATTAADRLRQESRDFQNKDDELRKGSAEAIRAESEARKANTDVMRSEYEMLKSKADRIAGNAQRFGGADVGTRMRGGLALDAIQAVGGDLSRLPHQYQDYLGALAPDLLRRYQEQTGENDPLYQRFQGAGAFGGDTESLADVRNRRDTLQQNINVKIETDTTELSRKIAESVSWELQRLLSAIRSEVVDALNRHRGEHQMQNAAQ